MKSQSHYAHVRLGKYGNFLMELMTGHYREGWIGDFQMKDMRKKEEKKMTIQTDRLKLQNLKSFL